MQVARTDGGDHIRSATHPEVGGGEAVNQQELPADGGADAVNEQEPLADVAAYGVRAYVAVPGADGPGEDQRLVALLRELVSGDRKMKTAAYLGVSYRTLDRALETGVLRSRIRDALKRRMLEEGGEAGLRHRARVEALERRAEAMDERVVAVEQAQQAEAEATGKAVGELARGLEDGNATVEALAGRLVRLEQQRARERRSGAVGNAAVEPVTWAGRGVVTAEPQPGEAESYGASMALVAEWRTLIRRRGEGSKTEQAKDRERVMELEIALIGEHGLALPPNTEPLHPSERERYLGWRRRELADLQSERRRRVALRWVRRVLTLGVWRR